MLMGTQERERKAQLTQGNPAGLTTASQLDSHRGSRPSKPGSSAAATISSKRIEGVNKEKQGSQRPEALGGLPGQRLQPTIVLKLSLSSTTWRTPSPVGLPALYLPLFGGLLVQRPDLI